MLAASCAMLERPRGCLAHGTLSENDAIASEWGLEDCRVHQGEVGALARRADLSTMLVRERSPFWREPNDFVFPVGPNWIPLVHHLGVQLLHGVPRQEVLGGVKWAGPEGVAYIEPPVLDEGRREIRRAVDYEGEQGGCGEATGVVGCVARTWKVELRHHTKLEDRKR